MRPQLRRNASLSWPLGAGIDPVRDSCAVCFLHILLGYFYRAISSTTVSGRSSVLGCAAANRYVFSFLYAHKINTLLFYDVNDPEYWGFASEY